MALQLPKQIIQFLTVLAAAVILLLSLLWGAASGQKLAQSGAVAANAESLSKGLGYFYRDQDRFPSAAEFLDDKNLMLNYFNDFPAANLPSAQCPSSFVYQRPDVQSFKLNFCLPAAWGNFPAGWNQLTESK